MPQAVMRVFVHDTCMLLLLIIVGGCVSFQPLLYSRPFEPRISHGNRKLFGTQHTHDLQYRSSPLLTVYTDYLGPSIFSSCRNIPSDSQYLRLALARGCNPVLSLGATVGRLLREHDLASISPHAPFVHIDHLVWPDSQLQCR